MARRRLIQAYGPSDESQHQPASLDLRLGKEVYRVRASFLPGRDRTVMDQLASLNPEPDVAGRRRRGARERASSISPR